MSEENFSRSLPAKKPGQKAEELSALLARLEKSNAAQEQYAKKQYYMSLITACSSVLVLCIVIYAAIVTMPRVNTLLDDLQASAKNIQQVSKELTEADLPQMMKNMNALVSTSETSIQNAMDKLNSIDFEALNSAITDLSNIVRPLGRLFGGQ